MSTVELKVNGLDYKVDIGLNTSLLEILRDRLGITSPKMGCNVGDCGACSVLLNGKLVRSCLTNGLTCDGKEVITVEGLAKPGEIHPLQSAFNEYGASQCGFCTPAMIIASKALLEHTPHPTREEDLKYSTYRGPWRIRFKDGVKKDGRIVARRIEAIREAGAYSSLNPYVTDKYCFLSTGCYFIPNVYVQGYCVYTNRPPASSMRGFGITPSSVTTELQMDKIAEAVGIDPWEIRFINAYRKGDQTPGRRVINSVALIEVMQTLAEKAGVVLPDRLKSMTSAERTASP